MAVIADIEVRLANDAKVLKKIFRLHKTKEQFAEQLRVLFLQKKVMPTRQHFHSLIYHLRKSRR